MRLFVAFLTLNLILVSLKLDAGTTGKISGRVVEASTNKPLPGVNILVEGTTMGASTDANGFYYIINVPVGTYALRAQMIGYGTVRVSNVKVLGDLTTEINFSLQTKVLSAGKVVEVVAQRPLVQKDLTSGRSIVTSEQIREMPVETVAGIINTKAGVVTDASGAIHIRGGRSSEVAYMIDGVPVTNPAWGGQAVGLENSAVKELQILSGTFNAEYGQAMSGIINIITKEGGTKLHGRISAYIGDYRSTHPEIFGPGTDFNPTNIHNLEWSFSGPFPGVGDKLTFFASGRFYVNNGLYRGVREHQIGDVNYLTSQTVRELQDSPYGRAGLLHFAEPFTDLNGDGKLEPGSEPYIDFDGDGSYTPGEPWRDVNGNGRYDHPGVDLNGDGFIDAEEQEFIDLNGNGRLDGDPFLDVNHNGVLDGEPWIDFNGNQIWDSGATGDSSIVRLNNYSRYNLQTKLTWRITPKTKLNVNFLRNASNSVGYYLAYKYNPDGRPKRQSYNNSLIVDLTHSISQSLFFNIKGAFYEDYSKTYFRNITPDGLTDTIIIEYPSLSDLREDLAADKLEGGTFYDGPGGHLLILKTIITINTSDQGIITYQDNYPHEAGVLGELDQLDSTQVTSISAQLIVNDTERALFLPDVLNNNPAYEYLGGGHSHTFTERHNKTYLVMGSVTWQMNNQHQFKAGAGLKQYQMRYRTYYVSVSKAGDWIPDARTPETSLANDSYDDQLAKLLHVKTGDRRPREAYLYIQDKIELTDMIMNVGIRYDYFDSNWYIPSDYKDPENPRYFRYTVQDSLNGEVFIDTLFGQEGEISAYQEILDTLDARGNPWKPMDQFYIKAPTVHQFSPRIGVAYPITDRGIIHFSYGHFFQIPTFAYQYANPEMEIGSDFRTVLGNAALTPQKTVSYEIGLQQQLTADLGMELIAFYKDFSGLLSSEVKETYNGIRYTLYSNRDYGHTKGVTISFTKRRTGLFSGTFDYTYEVAQGNASDPLELFYANQTNPPREVMKKVVPLDWDQRQTANANLVISQPGRWGVGLIIKYGSGLPYTPTIQGQRVDKPNSDRRPDYFNIDLNAHLDMHFGNIRGTLFAKVYNLLDRLNERQVFNDTGRATYSLIPTYVPDHGNEAGRHSLADYLTRPSYFSAPRQFRVGFSLEF